MKKLFLVDAYALIFKYYYAFLGRPMRNRAGMNTSVVFGFVKFLRDIQKRERPDLLGVAFDPKGGSFRREIFPEYKANRAETPEDILLSVPYVKRVLEAMCIPILEVEGYEADDVIGTLSQKGVEAGYEVFMVTPDKDYGQLVRDNCKIYKQKGAEGSIEIVDREAIRGKYGIDDPSLVRDILALWGDASDNIPGVPGIGEKSACKLVQEWGTVENILDNVSKIKGKQGEKIAEWGDKLRLAKTLTTICLDVPIPFREEDLTVCEPHIDELKALFAELDFKAFMNVLTNLAPPEEQPEGPRQEAQTQLAEMARAKSAAAKRAALVGQGNLFGDPVVEMPAAEVPVAELQAEADAMQFKTAQTTPHDYRLVENASQLREVVAEVGKYGEFCFDTETTGFDIFNDRIVGMSLAVKPFEAWYIPFKEENTAEYTQIVRPLFEDEGIAKIGQNIKFDLMVLRRLGLDIRGRKYDTMILHYLLDPESRHNMNALSEKYLNYKPIEIETLIGKGSKQLTMDLVNVERVKEYAAEDADVTLQLKHVLYPQVEKIGLQHLYFEVEEPMIAVLADIEMAGVRIDSGALTEYSVELSRRLAELEAQIRTEAGREGQNRTIACKSFVEPAQVFPALRTVLVHRDPERSQRLDVHQQIVHDHPRIAEISDQLVGQHHTIHSPERMVRGKEIPSLRVELFEPFDRIGHSPELKTSLDKLLRRKRGILIQNIVDFVLMDRALEPADNESRHPSGDPGSLCRKHGIDIYFRHNVTLLIIGRKSYDARFAPIAPTLGFPIETPHRYREIPEAGHPGLPEYDRSQPFFLR